MADETLCHTANDDLPGWLPNGRVTIEAAPPSAWWPCGVQVDSSAEYGGVRQIIDAPGPPGSAFSVFAALRPADPDPATVAVIAVYQGERLVGESRFELTPGENFAAFEGFQFPDSGQLKVVVASGADDSGDLVIDSVIMRPGLVRDVMKDAAGPARVKG